MPTQKGQSPLVPPYILQLPYDISRQLDTLPRFIDRERVYLWLFISCLVVKHTTQLIKYASSNWLDIALLCKAMYLISIRLIKILYGLL